LTAIFVSPAYTDGGIFEALLGDCLRALMEQGIPLALLHGPAAIYAPFGFASYRFDTVVALDSASSAPALTLRTATADDLDDIAALYAASYHELPLTEVRAGPDWRWWLGRPHNALMIDDSRGRPVAYAAIDRRRMQGRVHVAEAAAADAGAARTLLAALLAWGDRHGAIGLALTLAPVHPVAQAALQLGGIARLAATPAEQPGPLAMAGVVDLPGMLGALAPEFERRLAGSRYAGWSGNLRIEIETERITLALAEGRATTIDGSRPADLRLRQVTLPALAQLCLGYRAPADLRATGGLACDDSALGLLDALFPVAMAYGDGE